MAAQDLPGLCPWTLDYVKKCALDEDIGITVSDCEKTEAERSATPAPPESTEGQCDIPIFWMVFWDDHALGVISKKQVVPPKATDEREKDDDQVNSQTDSQMKWGDIIQAKFKTKTYKAMAMVNHYDDVKLFKLASKLDATRKSLKKAEKEKPKEKGVQPTKKGNTTKITQKATKKSSGGTMDSGPSQRKRPRLSEDERNARESKKTQELAKRQNALEQGKKMFQVTNTNQHAPEEVCHPGSVKPTNSTINNESPSLDLSNIQFSNSMPIYPQIPFPKPPIPMQHPQVPQSNPSSMNAVGMYLPMLGNSMYGLNPQIRMQNSTHPLTYPPMYETNFPLKPTPIRVTNSLPRTPLDTNPLPPNSQLIPNSPITDLANNNNNNDVETLDKALSEANALLYNMDSSVDQSTGTSHSRADTGEHPAPDETDMTYPDLECLGCLEKIRLIASLKQELAVAKAKQRPNATTTTDTDLTEKHYMPARAVQVEKAAYMLLEPDQQVPDNHTRMGGKLVVPTQWLASVLGKCKDKSKSFITKMLMNGFMEPWEATSHNATTIKTSKLKEVFKGLEVYALQKIGLDGATAWTSCVNSKFQACRRLMKQKPELGGSGSS